MTLTILTIAIGDTSPADICRVEGAVDTIRRTLNTLEAQGIYARICEQCLTPYTLPHDGRALPRTLTSHSTSHPRG